MGIWQGVKGSRFGVFSEMLWGVILGWVIVIDNGFFFLFRARAFYDSFDVEIQS
jgi:hypothetical protein